MPKTQTITLTLPDDAEDALRLVEDALERYCGTTYPILTHPVDDDIPQSYRDVSIIVGKGAL